MGKRSTIKMWGQHLYSDDTRRKLQKYHSLRKSNLKNRIYDTTTLFDRPLSNRNWVSERKNYSDERQFAWDGLASHKEKHKKYREVYGNALDTKYDTIPYIDVVGLNRNKRPSTFAEALDFFYPMSGVSSHISGHSPLTTTDPQEYDFEHHYGLRSAGHTFVKDYKGSNKNTTQMPVDLGEVTMMYLWFTIYKLLLSPKMRETLYIVSPDQFLVDLSSTSEKRSVLEPEVLRRFERSLISYVNSLKVAGKVADIGASVAKGYANDEFDDLDSFADFVQTKNLLEPLQEYAQGQFSKCPEIA